MKRVALLLLVIPLATACTTTRAQTPIDRPALEVPPVPPRIIEPLPAPEPALPEPVGDLPPERTTSRPRPQPQRDANKPETKPETAPPVEGPVQSTQPPAAPVIPPLRAGTNDSGEAARQVREILNVSKALLDRIDVQRLTSPRQALYKNAQMFMQRSEEALKAANYGLAKELADKAETIAKELQNR